MTNASLPLTELSGLSEIRNSIVLRTPVLCGCVHETRYNDLVKLEIPFQEAVRRTFCSPEARTNPLCAHSSMRKALADPYLKEIRLLVALGVLDATWIDRAQAISLQIFQVDGDAGISARAGTYDLERFIERQRPLVEALDALRADLLKVLDSRLQ